MLIIRRLCLPGVLALSSISASPEANAATIVKFLPPHIKQVAIESINASNVAVGFLVTERDRHEAFVRDADGTFSTFRVRKAGTGAMGINSSAMIVGSYDLDFIRGFLRAPDGAVTTFDVPGAGRQANQGTLPSSINDDGWITGGIIDKHYSYNGFVRSPDGTSTVFNLGLETIARYINNSELVSGDYGDGTMQHGFFREADGTLVSFDPPGSVNTSVGGMNNKGDIVGGFTDETASYAYIYHHSGGSFDIFSVPHAKATGASGINDDGVVTGIYVDSAGVVHGFVRSADGKLHKFDPDRSTNTVPECISNLGAVAGYFEFQRKSGGAIAGFLRFP